MRILITGAVAFVIWCFVSAWLYNDILTPLRQPVPVAAVPESRNTEADSLMKLKASMPANLLIYFKFDDSRFKPDPQFEESLAPFRAWIEKYPGSKLLVTGHTDLVGTAGFNQELGQKRAEVVSKYLVSIGVPSDRIITESAGKSQPAAEYISAEGRAKSRRTEISIKL